MNDRARRALSVASIVAACAMLATGAGPVAPAAAKTKERKPPPQMGSVDSGGSYQMSKEELAMDCKRITGKMQLRILQIRDYDPNAKSSEVSRSLQSVHAPIIGGSTFGVDPDARYRADRAMLEAYNRRLAEKKCRTFDLAAELKPKPPGDTPRPTMAPAAGAPSRKP